MAKKPLDERLVYLALKDAFEEPLTQLHTPKKIRRLIKKRLDKGDADITPLVAEHSIEIVCSTAKALLQSEIAESTRRLNIRFLKDSEAPPTQSAERSTSEAEATRSDADVIMEAAKGNKEMRIAPLINGLKSIHSVKGKEPSTPSSAIRSPKSGTAQSTISAPSLHPVYLPLSIQHRLLVKIQSILEEVCYTFAQATMGDTVQKAGWDCPESVELNTWTRLLRDNKGKVDAEKLAASGKPLSKLLDSIAQIRHTAVHRVRVSAITVQLFMLDAESLSEILHNDASAKVISNLRWEARQVIDELGRNKDLLESRLKERLQQIDDRRRELDILERKAIEDMHSADKEFQTIASANFEQIIRSPDLFHRNASNYDNVTGSELEVEIEGVGRRTSVHVGGGVPLSSQPTDIFFE